MDKTDNLPTADLNRLALYLSAAHPCSYLSERQASTLFVAPDANIDAGLYARLLARGFRRSGSYVYQPHCEDCHACVSVRIPVADYSWRRRERRILARNRDVTLVERPAGLHDGHYELYKQYISARHPGGGMEVDSVDSYLEFLQASWSDTCFLEHRQNGELLAVSVTDMLPDSLSAVYTFFRPDLPTRSLGTWAVLRQIQEAERRGLDWLYLGYWIGQCNKMRYKSTFRPLEAYLRGRWQRFESDDTLPEID